ncbi:MAG TPA: phospholipase D-like domain-containing protein [Thermodesulfovibrionales bacterium]|nr:phospholipase D-like domain-containing protein [Thermodesulfovibrionales bacterium]
MDECATSTSFTRETIQKIYGIPFAEGNSVTLLWKGRDSFYTIFDSIEKARELVCLEFYIFRNDETGNELAEILKRKVAEGARVYILYDHFGSLGTPMKFWKNLRHAGVQIRASHPFKWTDPFHYVHRDHKKLIVIDGTTAFTGGLNIANEYRGYHRFRKIKGWRDTGIFLEGPIVKKLLDIFRETWEIWTRDPIYFDKQIEPLTDGLPVLPIFASSAKGRRKMRKLLYYSITQAQHCIYLTTAYFTPSRRMLHVLEEAVLRGVKVKLLLPGKSDVAAAHYAGRAFFTKLLKAGVEIYNYQGEVLHAKAYVFDSVWSVIGSANLDFQSLRINDEGNVGIIDKRFGEQMIEVFYEDLKHSKQISLDTWLKRPLFEKVKEKFFAMFRRRL